MPNYALMKDGVFQRGPVDAPEDMEFPGFTKVAYDPKVHFKAEPEGQKKLWVRRYRFLGELHTPQQKIILTAVKGAAQDLTFSQKTSTDPTELDSNNLPVMALQGILVAYELMDSLSNRVDLLSEGTAAFFNVAKWCGVYGSDPLAADAEIARIMANEDPT